MRRLLYVVISFIMALAVKDNVASAKRYQSFDTRDAAEGALILKQSAASDSDTTIRSNHLSGLMRPNHGSHSSHSSHSSHYSSHYYQPSHYSSSTHQNINGKSDMPENQQKVKTHKKSKKKKAKKRKRTK